MTWVKMALLFSALVLELTACVSRKELGTNDNPIKIALTPGKDAETLTANGNIIKNHLEADLKLRFEITVPASYVAVVESLGSKRADFAILNTMGYLMAHQRYGAEAMFTLTDHGRNNYHGEIIAREDGPKTMREISGKKMAYVDPISSSGYILPSHLLKKNDISPKEIVFAGRHDSVVSMVYQKQVDAGATFWLPDENGEPWDARRLVLAQYPDVFKKIKIIAFTQDLPNEAFVVRNEFPADIRNKVSDSLKTWMQTDAGKKALKDLYNCDGLEPATDSSYNSARKVLKELGKKVEDLAL